MNDKATRHKYSGWGVSQREDDGAKAMAQKFAPEAQTDLEDAVEAAPKKRKKLEVVE
jgi:hypothetical protein